MKKNWKKVPALALAVSMALAPMTAWAEEVEDDQNTPVTVEDNLEEIEEIQEIENNDYEEEISEMQSMSMVAEAAPLTAGKPTNVTSKDELKSALEGAQSGDTIKVTDEIALDDDTITVPAGVTLDVSNYQITGTVNVAAGAKLIVVDDGVACQMIGGTSMDITDGQAQVKFANNTEIIIPEGTKAEIKGTFMDSGNGDDAYRLPKNDKLTVAGELTVAGGKKMEIAGTTEVTGKVDVKGENSAVEVAVLKSGTAGGTLDIKENGVVFVMEGARLTVPNSNVAFIKGNGKVITDAQSNVSVPDGSITAAKKYIITFDANGGEFPDDTITKNFDAVGGKLEKMPDDPIRSGYRFRGWDQTVDQDTVFTGNTAITAMWKKKDSSSSSGGSSSSTSEKNTVSVASDIENGKIKVDPSKAAKGDKVTITVTPDKGYEIDKVTVKDADGDKIELKDKGNGVYTFTMSDSKVEIKATFVKESEKVEEPVKPEEIPAAEKIILTVNKVEANVYGKSVVNDVAPIIRGERTMLPIRFVAEALGATVAWDGILQKVTITKGEDVIDIYINSAVAFVNGNPVDLDSSAFIENSRTYLPLRFVAENLGADVHWNAETKEVTVISNK